MMKNLLRVSLRDDYKGNILKTPLESKFFETKKYLSYSKMQLGVKPNSLKYSLSENFGQYPQLLSQEPFQAAHNFFRVLFFHKSY